MKQSKLKVYRGINVPFTSEETENVRKQFLRATISANLPFRWVEDPEVIKLFYLFRATAGAVIPNRLQVSGKLLDEEEAAVTKELKKLLHGKFAVVTSDGWKDESRDSVTGVNLCVEGKVRVVPFIEAMAAGLIFSDVPCGPDSGHRAQKGWRFDVSGI